MFLHTSSGQQLNWAFIIPLLNIALKNIEGGEEGQRESEEMKDKTQNVLISKEVDAAEKLKDPRIKKGPATAADADQSDADIQRKLRVNFVENFFRNPEETDGDLAERMMTWHVVGLLDGLSLSLTPSLFIYIISSSFFLDPFPPSSPHRAGMRRLRRWLHQFPFLLKTVFLILLRTLMESLFPEIAFKKSD